MQEPTNSPTRHKKPKPASATPHTAASGKQTRHPARKPKKKLSLGLRVFRHFGGVCVTTLLSFVLLFVIVGTIVGTALTIYVLGFMEETSEVSIRELEMSYSTFIYGYDGEETEENLVVLKQIDNEIKRLPVDIEQIPQHVRDAFVYAEDAHFYTHDGVDYKHTIAAFANMLLHFWDSERGGSTITQQLIKNLTGDKEIGPERKIREIFRAMQIEKSYSKDEILETYLNYIGFGGSANGIQMGAKKYFGKDVSELTVAEAACLAAIPKSPETVNPFAGYTDDKTGKWVNTGRARNRERQEYVLAQMYENGALSFDDYQASLNEKMMFTDTEEYKVAHPTNTNEDKKTEDEAADSGYTWVVDTAIREYADVLVEDLGITQKEAINRINKGGYQIYTNVDMEMQAYVEDKFSDLNNLLAGMSTAQGTAHWRDLDGDGKNSVEEAQFLQSSFCAIDYSGRVRAIVGAIGKKTGALCTSYAQEPQQPGSTIKPVTSYGLALSTDFIHWGTKIKDSPPLKVNGKPWPRNYSNSGTGSMFHVVTALQHSYNTIPAYLVKELGTDAVFNFATSTLGLELRSEDNNYAPLAVGGLSYGIPLENLVNAYMVYGNCGKYSKAHIISKVTKGDGSLIYTAGTDINQAVDEETATVMNRLLQNVINQGTGSRAKLATKDGTKIPLAGKTGTTSDWFDLTFVGLCPDFVSGMWIGYKENHEIQRHGSLNSARIWKNIIGDYITTHYSGNDFPYSEKVISGPMCTASGCPAGPGCGKGAIGYWKSTNAPTCPVHGGGGSGGGTKTPATTSVTKEVVVVGVE